MKKKKTKQETANQPQSVNTAQPHPQTVDTEAHYFLTNPKYNFLYILAIIIAGIIAYSNSFDCTFHFDDANIFKDNITMGSANYGEGVRAWPSRPIGILTFALNYEIHKLDLWGYHFVNLLIHLTNALLVWWLTWLTFSTPVMKDTEISRYKTTVAFLTGMLFVTHPLATQAVTYIAQRFASLATLFYLLSLILFVRGKLWQGDGKIAWGLFSGSMICALLGILTKEIVFTLPFAMLLYHYCFLQADPWKMEIKDKGIIIPAITFILVSVTLFSVRHVSLNTFNTVQPGQGYAYSISMKEYFLTQFSTLLTYLRLFFLPIHQNLDYDYPVSTSFFQLKTFLSFSLLAGILAGSVLLFKKYRLISFGILWFFLTMSVESSIIPISQNVIFEHRTYLSGFGFFLAFTGAFFYFFKEKYLNIAIIIILTIAAISTTLTYQRNKIWKDEYTLWTDCVKKSPRKARVHTNLGNAYTSLGKYQQAIEAQNEAIKLSPAYEDAYYNRGIAYGKLGQYQQTINDYTEAIRLKPDYVEAYYNRGIVYGKDLHQYQLAINDFDQAINLNPNHIKAYNNRGLSYDNLGQYQLAIDAFNKAISLKGDYADAYNNRSVTYLKMGDPVSCCRDALKACDFGNCNVLNAINRDRQRCQKRSSSMLK